MDVVPRPSGDVSGEVCGVAWAAAAQSPECEDNPQKPEHVQSSWIDGRQFVLACECYQHCVWSASGSSLNHLSMVLCLVEERPGRHLCNAHPTFSSSCMMPSVQGSQLQLTT